MRKIVSVAIVVFSVVGLAAAQIPTSGNVFFGYSYYNSKLEVNRASLNGWEGSIEGKIVPHVGIVADFSGHYGSQNFTTICGVPVGSGGGSGSCSSASTHELNVMFGPRVSIPVGKWTPFGEALVGVARISSNGFGNDNSLASAFGGGLDYRIIPPVAWRFQLDYMHTHLYSVAQNNFRFSTGIVLRF